MKATLKCVGVLLLAITLTSCGGGGGGSSSGNSGGGSVTPPVSNASPGGIWQGRDPQGFSILGLVAEDGRFQFVIDDGAPYTQYWGTLSTNGNTVSGSNIQVAYGTQYLGSATLTSGNITARQTLTGTVNYTPAAGCAVSICGNSQSFPTNLTFNPVYNQGGALSRIVGNWRDVETGQTININSAGVIFAQEAATGCVINGQVSTINTTYNAYSVSYTFSSCRFPYNIQNGTTATGLAFVDTSVSPNRAYFAGQYRVGNVAYTTYAYGPKT